MKGEADLVRHIYIQNFFVVAYKKEACFEMGVSLVCMPGIRARVPEMGVSLVCMHICCRGSTLRVAGGVMRGYKKIMSNMEMLRAVSHELLTFWVEFYPGLCNGSAISPMRLWWGKGRFLPV